jgi:hypothetical protein
MERGIVMKRPSPIFAVVAALFVTSTGVLANTGRVWYLVRTVKGKELRVKGFESQERCEDYKSITYTPAVAKQYSCKPSGG